MALMPEVITHVSNKNPCKTSIIGKSKYDGKPVLVFENVTLAKEFIKRAKQPPQVTWFKQTITEEEIQI